jgi:tetratricopeptide (TPR) repeat protein
MKRNQKIILISAISLIALLNLNSLKVPLYFDDFSVITEALKIDNLSLKNLYNVSMKGITKNRPFSNFTLALNYYFSNGPNPFQFHLINITIHILCFLFVFLFTKELLALPSVPQRYRSKSLPVALISSFLWAVHPIQTQSVTYIVQRMTSLCTLFYFMCLYFYLKARISRKPFFYALSGLSFLFALGSKEIAATLPAAVLLIEWIFFKLDRKKLLVMLLIFIISFTLISYLFIGKQLKGTVQSLKQNKYSNRDFSISERLLTEPRAFVHYISLVIFPFYDRYILDYDFKVSRSLFSPMTTVFSLFFVLGTILIAFLALKKNKILSFCIFSFWLGHLIEGSIFNLEIAFEHRMYMPSVFLILIIIAIFVDLSEKNIGIKKYLTIFLAILIIYLGVNTYLRNDLWIDPVRFFTHNIKKAPHNYRPYHNLGVTYGIKGEYNLGLDYFSKALSLNKNSSITHFGIALCYFNLKDYEKSISFYLKTLEMNLKVPDVYINMGISYFKLNKHEDGFKTFLEGLKMYPKNSKLMVSVGSSYYYTIQQLGNDASQMLEKYGINEAKAFELLESAYLLGNRDKDIFANLPPAYVKKAKNDKSREKQSELLKIAETIMLEGFKKYPDDEDLRNNLIGIYIVSGKWRDALNLPGLTKNDLNKLTIFLLNNNQFNDALDVINKTQGKFGLDQVIEFNQAICFYFIGDEEKAIQIFKRIFDTTNNDKIKFQANYFIQEWQKKHVRK